MRATRKFTMEIALDGAAFDNSTLELHRLICEVAGKVAAGLHAAGTIWDHNGNRVGTWNYSRREGT